MGCALKRAQRAKRKSKQNRLERHYSRSVPNETHVVKDDYMDDTFFTPSKKLIEVFKDLPCPDDNQRECIDAMIDFVEQEWPEKDNDSRTVLSSIMMMSYLRWRATSDGSLNLTPE